MLQGMGNLQSLKLAFSNASNADLLVIPKVRHLLLHSFTSSHIMSAQPCQDQPISAQGMDELNIAICSVKSHIALDHAVSHEEQIRS